jgi:hypothetical protein
MAIRIRRTLGQGPPPLLLFGELAYSDLDQVLWIGRPQGRPPLAVKIGEHHSIRMVSGGVRLVSLGVRQCKR